MPAPSHGQPSLDSLAQRAAAGDETAFTALVTATIDDLRLFIAVRLTCLDTVEEIVQATYIACWQSLPTYVPTQPFLPWLRGIARHRLGRQLRTHQRQRRLHTGAWDDVLAMADPAPTDDPAETGRIVTALRRCLATLSDDARALLDGYYSDGHPLGVLAAQRGRKVGAVAASLHRLRQVLRQCLERQDVHP